MLFSTLFQEGPANTTNYMIAGYAVIFGVMLLYLISLMVRQRNLQKDLEVLQEIQGEQE
jgi:hypothetical protein